MAHGAMDADLAGRLLVAKGLARDMLKNSPPAVQSVVAARRSMPHEIDVIAHAVAPRALSIGAGIA